MQPNLIPRLSSSRPEKRAGGTEQAGRSAFFRAKEKRGGPLHVIIRLDFIRNLKANLLKEEYICCTIVHLASADFPQN